MDRTTYGKTEAGARQPFRCTVKERGIAPACKLFEIIEDKITIFHLTITWIQAKSCFHNHC
jgi:hypothetical protein